MFTRRTDLQLERDTLGRFLPWLIAFMVYLSVLALAGMLALDRLADNWDKGMRGALTVQLPPSPEAAAGGPGAARAKIKDEKRLQAAQGVLESTPGVTRAEILNEDKLLALVEPWLGGDTQIGDFPMPRLIDVEVGDEDVFNMDLLKERLAAAAPNAQIDDHGIWLQHLIRLISSVKALAFAILAFIGLATIGTVVFTTRTGLAIHQDAIEVLHLIGAQDSYIARQFASRALMLGMKGGLIGLGLALPTLWTIGYIARMTQSGVMPDISLSAVHWAALILLPVAVAAIAMLTAQRTVMKTLSGML